MFIKLLHDIGHDIHDHAEGIAAFGSCFLVVNTISWQSEIIRFTLGIAASIISGYIVNRLKRYWDSDIKKEKRNGKKSKIN